MAKIFKYHVYLKVCKRLRKEEGRQEFQNIYIDNLEKNVNARDLLKKYFKYTTDKNMNNNVAYLNDTCKEVANQIRKCKTERVNMK